MSQVMSEVKNNPIHLIGCGYWTSNSLKPKFLQSVSQGVKNILYGYGPHTKCRSVSSWSHVRSPCENIRHMRRSPCFMDYLGRIIRWRYSSSVICSVRSLYHFCHHVLTSKMAFQQHQRNQCRKCYAILAWDKMSVFTIHTLNCSW